MPAKPIPIKIFGNAISWSVLEITLCPDAAFLTSEIEREIPVARLFLILNNVNAALTNIPPIAIGLTMNFQILVERAIQSESLGVIPAKTVGAMKYEMMGTNNPQANNPPLKFNAASFGPMI